MEWRELETDNICDLLESAGNTGDGRSHSRVHVSQLISGLGAELQIPPFHKRKDGVNLLERAGNAYSEFGFTWEEVLSMAFKERLGIRPGEVELDGVVGSPDGMGMTEEDGMFIEEYKCTWKSVKHLPHLEWRYMMQVHAYCKIMDLTKVLFHVFYVNGNYSPPMPVAKAYFYEFTQDEIDQSWNQLISFGQMKGLL